MKIQINLPDKNYCNGCRLLRDNSPVFEYADCLLYNKEILSERLENYRDEQKFIRPEHCKQENGD